MGRADDAPASPYSRTGLFPWGATYDVPARRSDAGVVSQTPCHLRRLAVPPGVDGHGRTVECPDCGRRWAVRVGDGTPLHAIWTA